MAVHAGPQISDEGLVLTLDAANPRSYPGSGTIWNDLSGNGNNGTLQNSPTYVTDNGGSIIFDGVNDYVSLNASNSTNIRGSFTVSMLCKSNWTSYTGWNIYWSGVSKYSQFILGPNTINGKMAFLIHSGTWYPTNYSATSVWNQTTIDPRVFHLYTGVYDQSSGYSYLYVDGELECSFNVGSRILTDDLDGFAIGKRDVSSDFLNITLTQVQLHNRALSQSEIKQNFEATRDRYGI